MPINVLCLAWFLVARAEGKRLRWTKAWRSYSAAFLTLSACTLPSIFLQPRGLETYVLKFKLRFALFSHLCRIEAYTQPCLCEVFNSRISMLTSSLFSCFSFRVVALISPEWRLLRLRQSTHSTMHIIPPLHPLPPFITLHPLPQSTPPHHLAHQHHPLHPHRAPSHHSHHLLTLHPQTGLHPLHGPHLAPLSKEQTQKLSQKHFSSHFQQYCTNSITGVALTFWVTRWASLFDFDFF